MSGPTATETVSWQRLAAAEPRLAALENGVRAAALVDRGRRRFCANSVFYRRVKPRLSLLVGWGRREQGPDVLFAYEAYDLAYKHLFDLLPDCRHEGGCWG